MKDEKVIEQEILSAAKGLIQQYGMNKVTMRDVAKAAGKGKSTLYYYFKNKEEIFDAVVKGEMDDFFFKVKRAVDKEEGVENKLKTYYIKKVTLLQKKVKQYQILIENDEHHFDMHHYFSINLKENGQRELDLIISFLDVGVANGLFNKEAIAGQKGRILAEVFLSGIRGVELEVFIQKEFSFLHEKAELMIEVLIKALK